jgi:hypothetical protein
MVAPDGSYDPAKGWQKQYNSVGAPLYSAHYESYIWAVYLWAYSQCGYQPLYDRAFAAIENMMTNYPTKC